MEYTKDIVLDVKYKSEMGVSKLKTWTSNVLKYGKENQIIFHIISILILLISIDLILVSSFLQLLSEVY